MRRRHVVTIQTVAESSDGDSGQVCTDLWRNINARIMPVGGNERLRGAQVEAGITHLVEIGYRPYLNSSMRVLADNRTRVLNCVSVIDPDERKRRLILNCVEGVST